MLLHKYLCNLDNESNLIDYRGISVRLRILYFYLIFLVNFICLLLFIRKHHCVRGL